MRERRWGRRRFVVISAIALALLVAAPELAISAGAVAARGEFAAKHRKRGVSHHRHAKKGHHSKRGHSGGTKHRKRARKGRRGAGASRVIVVSGFRPKLVRHTSAIAKAKRPARGHYFRGHGRKRKALRPRRHARAPVHSKTHKKKRATGSGGLRHYVVLVGGGSIGALSLYLIASTFRGGSRARAQGRARSRLRARAPTGN